MQKQLFFVLFPFIFLSFLSCRNENEATGPEFHIVRYDRLLMQLDTNEWAVSFQKLRAEHPYFTDIYFSEVIPIPGYGSSTDSFLLLLKDFLGEPGIRELYSLTQKVFPDLNREERALQEAFLQAKKYFPDIEPPRIYTCITEFGFQRFLFEDGEKDGIGIGLDLFLDPELDYTRLESGTNTFSTYLTRSYDREHLMKKLLESWLEDQMGPNTGNRLVDEMLYQGKKLYLLDQVTEIPDTILLEYTPAQLAWLENNEKEMWSYYLEKDWFYTTDPYIIKRLTFPAPNTMALGMPSEAPGRTANYLGWKIVREYMKRHPETTFDQLNTLDAQRLLETSRFKPGLK